MMEVSKTTVYRMIRNKQIPAIKFGNNWKIPVSYVESMKPNQDRYRI
jgi:excisionase family DNA binding protein